MLEIIAVIVSLLGVYLTAKEKVICWPVGIAGCIIYTVIFFKASLFADATLQVFYVIISFYGWYEWLYGRTDNKQLSVSKTHIKTYFYLGVIALVSSVPLVMLLIQIKDSSPVGDGITAVMSIIATWMMAKKLIENWIIWIVIDAVYVFIYIFKNLLPTALLYFIFIPLAIYGYYLWKKQLKVLSVSQ